MAVTVAQLGEAWGDSTSNQPITATTASFTYHNGKLVLVAGYGRRGTSDPILSVSWTGTPTLTQILDISGLSGPGMANIKVYAALPTSDGSATATGAISSGNNAGCWAGEFDGADLSNGLTSAIRQNASGGTWSPSPLSDSMLIAVMGALTSGPPSISWIDSGSSSSTLDTDYNGIGGSWTLDERHDGGGSSGFSASGGSTIFLGHIEIKAAAAAEPESYWGIPLLG